MKSDWSSIRASLACLRDWVTSHSDRMRFIHRRTHPFRWSPFFKNRHFIFAVLPVHGSPRPAPIRVTAPFEM